MRRLYKSSAFYQLFHDKDLLTLDEAYMLAKITNLTPQKKSKWLRNKLTGWKKRGIAEPVYGFSSRSAHRRLLGIRLTTAGRALFGRAAGEDVAHSLTLDDVIKKVSQLKRDHPDFEITFEIHPKTGVVRTLVK